MNHIVIMGRMTRDPELRHTQSGTPVASFTLAVDRGFTPKDGGEKQTDFIDVVAWERNAEFVTKYFVKGQLVAVSGRLQIREWVDKEHNKRRSAEVVADRIYFTGDRRDRDGAPQGSGGGFRSGSEPYGGGGYQSNSGGYQAPSGGGFSAAPSGDSFAAPTQSSGFAELDDDDGELPF